MDNLDEYKELWQKQKVNMKAAFTATGNAIPNILDKLKKFERKQFGINLTKTIIVALIILTMFFFLGETNFGLFSITGIVIIFSSVVSFLIIYWKKQFKVSELNLDDSSNKFLEHAVFKLNEQKKLFKVYFPYFGAGLIAGLNLLYLDMFEGYELSSKFYMHLGMSTLLLVAILIGWKIRMYRIRKEWQPLIDELTDIKNDLINEGKNEFNT